MRQDPIEPSVLSRWRIMLDRIEKAGDERRLGLQLYFRRAWQPKGNMMTYAVVTDVTPNNGTIVAISSDASELIDLHTDDTMRAIRLESPAQVGERIAIDWDTQAVNLADCMSDETKTATITVTWSEISGEGRLIARCDENPTYASNVVRWENPIDASTDSWAIANAVTSINGAEILAVDHERDTVLITVDNATVDA